MNALMTIQVRVMSAQAIAQLRAVEAQSRKASMGSAGFTKSLNGGIPMLSKWGNQVQWAGRQLMYNFTLPIVAAMGYATKWALANEAGMVRVQKVYGDTSMSATQVRQEVEALGGAFEALSSIYGVQQSEVLGIAGDWAAAGASGLALAKITKLTLETMVLGEQDAATATKNLIAIQAQYGMNTAELTKTIDILNMTENQTGTTLKDLMEAMARSAGVAKTAGVSIRELAAMTAALTPTTGSAANAGNGLKTVISRLLSPTNDAVEIMGLMGVKTNDAAFASLNATDRLMVLAKAYKNLTGAQKIQAASIIASRYQVNRFTTLMDALNDKNSYYWKSLKSTNSRQELFAQRQKELNAVLDSSPQKLKQVGVILQNSMANVIVPLVPAITALAQWIAKLGNAFQNLDGDTQKLVLVSLLFLAAIGPIARYVGAVANLIGLLGAGTRFFVKAGLMPLILALKLVLAPFRLMGAIASAVFGLLTGAGTSATRAIIGQQRSQTQAILAAQAAQTDVTVAGAAARSAATEASESASTAAAFAGIRMRSGYTTAEIAQIEYMTAARQVNAQSLYSSELRMTGYTAAGSTERIALTETEMATRLIAVDSQGVARVQGEYAAQAAASAAVSTGAMVRVDIALAEMVNRTFVAQSGMTARLAIESAEAAARVTIAEAGATGTALAEIESQAAKTLALRGGIATRSAEQAIANTSALTGMTAYYGAEQALALEAAAIRLALESKNYVTLGFITEAFYQYMLELQLAYNMSRNILASSGSASLLAIEGGTWASRDALAAGGSASLLAIESGANGARVASSVAADTAIVRSAGVSTGLMVGFWASARAKMVAIATSFVMFIPRLFMGLLAAMTSPVGLAVIAILGLIYVLRDKIKAEFLKIKAGFGSFAAGLGAVFAPVVSFFDKIVSGISKAFWALPDSITGALIAVVRVVREAALQVYEWLSYLNPFAHHSPSVVENVNKGMDVVDGRFRKTQSRTKSFVSGIAADLSKFKKMLAGVGGGEFSDDRADVAKGLPKALPLFDKLVGKLNKLKGVEAAQAAAVDKQQKVVDKWKSKLDAANASLDKQQAKLDRLQDNLDKLQSAYDAASDAISDYASAPIAGMGAMNDAIFANEIAQKKLQLAMSDWEATNGSIDDTTNKLSLLRGDIDLLQGKAADLRASGAGSDVLGPINDQIAAMQAQANAFNGAVSNSPITKMQSQLDDLKKQGEMLQLQYDINYDPLTRSIENLANAQKELSYDDIVRGIKDQQAAMASLQPQIDSAAAKVATQQAVVDQYTAARDKLNETYNKESAQLDALNDRYQKTKDLVGDITSALNDMGSAAAKANSAKDEAKKAKKGKGDDNLTAAFKSAGAGGDFAKVGSSAAISRLTDGNEADMIEEWAKKQNEKLAKSLGGMDMFGPIKKKWNEVWGWVKTNIGPVADDVATGIKSAFSKIDIGNPFDKIGNVKDTGAFKDIKSVADSIGGIFDDISKGAGHLFDLIKPDLQNVGDSVIKFRDKFRDEVLPMFDEMKPVFRKLGDAISNFWTIAKPVLLLFSALFIITFKVAFSIASKIVESVLALIFGVIKNTLQIIMGVIKVFVGLFTGDWKMLWDGILDIVGGAWGLIWTIIKNATGTVWAIVKGFVEGVVGFFKWLYDVLVGHSIVPDLMDGIIATFHLLGDLAQWVWDNVLKPVYDFFVQAYNWVTEALALWWAGVKVSWDTLKKAGQWVWDNMLKPVWDKVVDAWNWVKDELVLWWDRIKTAWNSLKNAGQWIWDNLFTPVINQVKGGWSAVGTELGEWWGRVKSAWDGLTKGADWVKTNLMDPVLTAFQTGWNAVKDWFKNNADTILSPIKSVVRGMVGAINWLIKGLNAIGKLPGIDIKIGEITLPETFEVGGMMSRSASRGLVTNGARAIVGEGKANYPEYVIPTDPTHRNRARMLLGQAAGKVGMDAIPMHADGGILGKIKDKVGGVADKAFDKLKDIGRGAVSKAASPFIAGARTAVDALPTYTLEGVDVPKVAGNNVLDRVQTYISGAEKVYQDIYDQKEKAAKAAAKAAAGGATTYVPDPANPGGHAQWKGGTFSNRFIAHMIAAEKKAGQSVNVIQGGFRPATSYSGTSHQGDAVDMSVNYALLNAFRAVGIAAGDRTGLGNWSPHIHAVPGPSAGYGAGSAVWQFQDYVARGGASQSPTSPWGLANGAIVRASRGGSNVTIGEGKYDEAVTPLPRGWQTSVFGNGNSDSKGDTYVNIDNVSFPNITDPNDAKTLLENLKNLAKD